MKHITKRVLSLLLTLAMLCSLLCTAAFAATPYKVTVGEGTVEKAGYYAPYAPYYLHSLEEMIYPAEDIRGAGVIQEIAFQVATMASYTPDSVTIYLGHTSKDEFTTTTDWIAAADLTAVYEGTPKLGTAEGWETITLDEPFSYNGTDNLVIAVSKTASGSAYSATLAYYYAYTSGNTVLRRYTDSALGWEDYSNVSAAGYLEKWLPNLRLTMVEAADEGGSEPEPGHHFEYVMTVKPTCTEEGYDLYACTDDGCNETMRQNFVPATGHTWGSDGLCTECGAAYVWDGDEKTEPALCDGVYLISTGGELAWFASQVNTGKTALNARLTADINLGNYAWKPIGNSSTIYYSGTFDGDGHAITGLKVVGGSTDTHVGLFGYAQGATIKNLAVYGTVTGWSTSQYVGGCAGGFVGWSNGITMENCANYATVSGRYAGGLVGYVQNSNRTAVSITNCYNAGTVGASTSSNEAGGLFGELAGTNADDKIENCFTYGTIVSANSSYIGTVAGFVGRTLVPVNFFYLNTQTYASAYTLGTGKNAEEFKTLAAALGDAFVDSEELGHPVLKWEVAEAAADLYAVTLDNRTGANTPAVITGLTGGNTYSGSVAFNVACDKVCAVAYTTDGGATYTRLTAAANESGGYDFTVEVTEEMEIAIAIAGDVNGDGAVNGMDTSMLARANLSETQAAYLSLDGLAQLAGDVNGDGAVNGADTALLARANLSETQAAYQALAW